MLLRCSWQEHTQLPEGGAEMSEGAGGPGHGDSVHTERGGDWGERQRKNLEGIHMGVLII